MRTFTIVILGIFGFFIVAGVISVATFGKFGGDDAVVPAQAVIWGTLPRKVVESVVDEYNQVHDNVLSVTYRELDPSVFDAELAESLAAGTGPDAIIISQGQLMRHEDKLYPISFESFSERLFRDTFVQGAEIFLNQTAVLAFPVMVDPMVMYWNRTLFANARIVEPPRFWDELLGLGAKLTIKDESFNVSQSLIALGEYRNVTNAKEIIAMLALQAGDPIAVRGGGGSVSYVFGDSFGLPEAPGDAALRFYTEFANPVKPAYSWNRALPSSRDMFLRGDVALYLGFGSELFDLQRRNPNLNFDMTAVPQVRGSSLVATFGNIYGIALIKQSNNIAGAYRTAMLLSDADAGSRWASIANAAPVRRDLLVTAPSDPYDVILYEEALIARGFLDPDPARSGDVFATLVEDILFNRSSVSSAVSTAAVKLDELAR